MLLHVIGAGRFTDRQTVVGEPQNSEKIVR
ncbi:hypothetical protein WP2W18C05_17160 [Aeromonas sp. WP2-W18-CRE-05]|jgi:hypothetical protein|nr:hypothetical protein WP2W18C05_17160 [Aeromonas sp. WP2-W18-CRE-05]